MSETHRTSRQLCTRAIFAVYILILIWFILFKLAVRPEMLIRARVIMLIPFRDVSGSQALASLWAHYFNVLLFIPFGAYLSHFRPGLPPGRRLLAGLGLSLTFEVLQYIFRLGGTDVTDLLTNTLGTAAGMGILHLLKRPFPRRAIWIINGVMIPAELLTAAVLIIRIRQ